MHTKFLPGFPAGSVRRMIDLSGLAGRTLGRSMWKVLLFAAFEAHAAGESLLTTDHLLLGALRTDRELLAWHGLNVERIRAKTARPHAATLPDGPQSLLQLEGDALDLVRRARSARDIVDYGLDLTRGC